MKIVVLDGFLVNPGDISWEPIARQGEFTMYENTEPDEVAAHIGGAEAVFVNRCSIGAAAMDACPNLRFINTFATGFNMIDIAAAKKRGITVCNVPAYSTHAVAQMAAALLLQDCLQHGCVRSLHQDPRLGGSRGPGTDRDPTDGACGKDDRHYRPREHRRKLGGDRAGAWHGEVLAYRRRPNSARETEHLHFVPLEELYANSDVISIHCPLNDESRGMIGEAAIRKMKDGVILINTARGAVLDDAAVVRALDSGKIYAVGADVFAPEPCGKEHPLAMHPRCVATPHVGWAPAGNPGARHPLLCGESRRLARGKGAKPGGVSRFKQTQPSICMEGCFSKKYPA